MTQVQYLLLLAGETAWIYPWGLALGRWAGGDGGAGGMLSLPEVLLLLLLAATGAALAPRRARMGLGLAGVAAAALAALARLPALEAGASWDEVAWQLLQTGPGGPAASAAVFAVFVWWRGLGVGRSRPSLAGAEGGFRLGLLALGALLVLVVLAGPSLSPPSEALALSTLALVFAGLVGVPLARVVDESEMGRRQGAAPVTPGGFWLAALLGTVAALLAAALLLAQIFTFQRIGDLLQPVAALLGQALGLLLFLVALPLGLLLEGILLIVRFLMKPGTIEIPSRLAANDWLDQLRKPDSAGPLPPEALLALKVATALGLVALAIWILVRAAARVRGWGEQEEVEETRDFVWNWPGWAALARRLMGRLRPRRLRRGPAIAATGPAGGASLEARELYRQFLALGAAFGRARRPPETPLEFERRLADDPSLPGAVEVRSITDGYVQARYAPPAGPRPDLPGLASALARLRALWQARASS